MNSLTDYCQVDRQVARPNNDNHQVQSKLNDWSCLLQSCEPTDIRCISFCCQTFRFISCYPDVKFIQLIWQKVHFNNITDPDFQSYLDFPPQKWAWKLGLDKTLCKRFFVYIYKTILAETYQNCEGTLKALLEYKWVMSGWVT